VVVEFSWYPLSVWLRLHRLDGIVTLMGRESSYLPATTKTEPISPSAKKQAKKMANERARRYKHITNPGEGLLPNQIEAIIYTF
jgi:hypothetical protein